MGVCGGLGSEGGGLGSEGGGWGVRVEGELGESMSVECAFGGCEESLRVRV